MRKETEEIRLEKTDEENNLLKDPITPIKHSRMNVEFIGITSGLTAVRTQTTLVTDKTTTEDEVDRGEGKKIATIVEDHHQHLHQVNTLQVQNTVTVVEDHHQHLHQVNTLQVQNTVTVVEDHHPHLHQANTRQVHLHIDEDTNTVTIVDNHHLNIRQARTPQVHHDEGRKTIESEEANRYPHVHPEALTSPSG